MLERLNDHLVCTCMAVMYSEIMAALEQGCTTLPALSDALGVGSGCSSCIPEITDIIEKYRDKDKK